MRLTIIKPVLLFLLLIIPFILQTKNVQASEPFPIYPAIKANISFWEKVYSQYSTTQGILHDKDDLNIIYSIVDLVPWESPGAARINRKLIKISRERYKTILLKLSKGKSPSTKEEIQIASLFTRKNKRSFKKARNNIRLQIGQKDRFRSGVIRSGASISEIKKIFISYQLPEELAYLPHVESSYNNNAHSKAGAVGLWQFTKGTGKEYLTINNELDERFDILLATHAAAQFLKENHEKLGTWPLALTAYNYGQTGMRKAVKMKKNYEAIFKTYKAGRFKFASRNFYSEFIAAKNIARRLESDRKIIVDQPEATIAIRMKYFCSSQKIMNFFNISSQDFVRLNPALKKSVINGNKHIPKQYLLKVPATQQTRTLARKIPGNIYYQKQIPDTVYMVRRGDTVNKIARKYKTTPKKIISLNNLNKRATIRLGQLLRIPQKKLYAKKIQILSQVSKRKPI